MTPEQEVAAMSTTQVLETLRDYKGHAAPRCLRDKAAHIIEQQAKEIEELKASTTWPAIDGHVIVNYEEFRKTCLNFTTENQTLRNQIEELKETCLAIGRSAENEFTFLRTQNERLVKALENLSYRMETAIECLVEAGGNKKYDPSWIRPMTLTRTEVNQACINAYNQIQVGLEEAKALLAEVNAQSTDGSSK